MYICPQKLADYLLCNSNLNLPINKSHYITGNEISLFSKLVCIEKELTCLTCNLKGFCTSCKSHYFR